MAGSLALGELSCEASGSSRNGLALAERADDGELRAMLRRSVLPGSVRVAFTREPEYFAGEKLAGGDDCTIVARHDGELVGMARCTVNTFFRNGRPQRIGYLGELRLTRGTRAAVRWLRDGYAFLGQVVGQARVGGCFTSITADNRRARRVLENGKRLGLPEYRPLAALVTLVAPVARTAPVDSHTNYAVSDSERLELVSFLSRQAEAAQLTLAWDAAQWEALATHGISTREVCVVRRGGAVVAAAAVWDQRSFRQTVIDGYGGPLRLGRPLLNAFGALTGRPPLPAPGSVLAQGALLGASVLEVADWSPLWHALRARAAALGLEWIVLSRDARDPELPILRRLLHAREYHTILYEVTWRDGPEFGDVWDSRVFRPEVALL